MKRVLLVVALVFATLTCSAQKQKSFFYDGIELHNVKGWTILPSKDGNNTTINIIRVPFQMTITKQGMPNNKSVDNILSTIVENLMETSLSGSKKAPMIKETSPVMEGYINNIPVKYIDITYTKKVKQRVYGMNIYNSLFTIICSGEGGSHDAVANGVFGKILSSFTYNPESGTHRLF